MKVLLVTIAIGKKYIEEYKYLFYESQQQYAMKHGYDFKLITDFLDPRIKSYDSISFNKILVCSQEWSHEYDFIIFIDADILINRNSPSLHDYVDYGDSIGIIDEYSQPTNEKRIVVQKLMNWETTATEYYKLAGFDIQTDIVMNSGVIVMQPKKHNAFLQMIYNTHVLKSLAHPRGFHLEQSSLGYELQKANLYKLLDNKFNALWSLTKIYNVYSPSDITLQQFVNDNYFIHFAGHVDFDKIKALQF